MEIGRWKPLDQWSVGIQLTRAADSIGANIAEATGRWHQRDQIRFLLHARGSLAEVEHWIGAATRRGLLRRSGYGARVNEIAQMLNGLIAKRRSL